MESFGTLRGGEWKWPENYWVWPKKSPLFYETIMEWLSGRKKMPNQGQTDSDLPILHSYFSLSATFGPRYRNLSNLRLIGEPPASMKFEGRGQGTNNTRHVRELTKPQFLSALARPARKQPWEPGLSYCGHVLDYAATGSASLMGILMMASAVPTVLLGPV
jgi:hypothetical protein